MRYDTKVMVSVTYRLVLSRDTTGLSFKFISYVEVMISGNCVHCSSKPFVQKALNVKRQKYKTVFKQY